MIQDQVAQMFTHFLFLHMQELTNPLVEAPGKGYIGKYNTKGIKVL